MLAYFPSNTFILEKLYVFRYIFHKHELRRLYYFIIIIVIKCEAIILSVVVVKSIKTISKE